MVQWWKMKPVGDEIILAAYFKCKVGEYFKGLLDSSYLKFSIQESRLYITTTRIVLEPEHSFTELERGLKKFVINGVGILMGANPLMKTWYADLETYHPNNEVISIPRVAVKSHETIERTFGYKKVVTIFFADHCIPIKMPNEDATSSALTDIVTDFVPEFLPPDEDEKKMIEMHGNGVFDADANEAYLSDLETLSEYSSADFVLNPARVWSTTVSKRGRNDPNCLCCRHFMAARGIGRIKTFIGGVFTVSTAGRTSCAKCALTGAYHDLTQEQDPKEVGAECSHFQTIVPESYDNLPNVSVSTLGSSSL